MSADHEGYANHEGNRTAPRPRPSDSQESAVERILQERKTENDPWSLKKCWISSNSIRKQGLGDGSIFGTAEYRGSGNVKQCKSNDSANDASDQNRLE